MYNANPYLNYGANLPSYINGYAQQIQTQAQQTQNNGITWVQGESGAKAFSLPPNSNILLMDSESSKFYIKTTDNVGMASMKSFNFNEVIAESESKQVSSDYVTRKEFEELKGMLTNAKSDNANGTKARTKKQTNGDTETED